MPISFKDASIHMRHPTNHSKDRIERVMRVVDAKISSPGWLRKNCQHVKYEGYEGENFQWKIHIEEAISESEATHIQNAYKNAGWPFSRVTQANPYNTEGHMTLVELGGEIDIFRGA